MSIKNIELKKGMTKQEVNELISEWILLEDDIFGKTIDKHTWKCKCGNLIKERAWNTIRRSSNVRCSVCEREHLFNQHKYKVESSGNHIYIKSYFKGEKLPNGKNVEKNKTYVKYIHKYCGSIRVSRADYISCTECCGTYENSLAYHIEQELGEPLEKYWDFEKNTVNPYHICKGSTNLKIWIKCQNEEINELNGLKKKDYHPSYEVSCSNFVKGARCGYCNPKKSYGSHPYDSFGYYNFDKVINWHPSNNISPFRIAPNTTKKYKFVCLECGHINTRKIVNVNTKDSVCVLCGKSKGEKKIKAWLDYNNVDYIYDEPYFDDLIGVGGGVLRPDFILPDYKIWIEYDGEFHYKDIYKDGYHKKQLINDKRKNKYAKINGWNLIRIPYIEFDNIENILEKELLNYV